jgi:hypothetical protein
MFQWIGERLASTLTKPLKGFTPLSTTDPEAFARALRPADVVLIEGNTRIASAIKYLTQSTWSHSALYVGPMPGRAEPDGEPHVMIEADVQDGVISVPLSRYATAHTRICRPVGLSTGEARAVTDFAVARIGYAYDLRNFIDLARYFMPTPPLPSRFRRRMIALGSGSPTRAICSTLIAQAYQSVNYPILPSIEAADAPAAGDTAAGASRRREILHIRDSKLFVPRDYDISPYFAIIKPSIEKGFDFHQVAWAAERAAAPPEPGQ